jgi:hypothetical protein
MLWYVMICYDMLWYDTIPVYVSWYNMYYDIIWYGMNDIILARKNGIYLENVFWLIWRALIWYDIILYDMK